MVLKLLIFGLTFSSAGLLGWACYPIWSKRVSRYQAEKVEQSARQLNNMFLAIPQKKILLIHTLAPLLLGGLAFLVSGQTFIALIAAGAGLILPTIVIKNLDGRRRKRFQAQLLDALMILSSSLKGGLSLLQSIEAMIEEMSPPISQEFSLLLRENKMGVPLDESLQRLNRRMRSEVLALIVTAISVARETGGELPQIFTRLTYSIRETNKLQGKIAALTVQGKLQGAIMSLLPIAFAALVYSLNPGFFDIMLRSDLGRLLLGYAAVSQVVGIFLIMKLSKVAV